MIGKRIFFVETLAVLDITRVETRFIHINIQAAKKIENVLSKHGIDVD